MPPLFPSPDVLIIGAGPAGTTAAALLAQTGWDVLVVERSHFPRFSIGESLLPQAMEFLEASGALPAIERADFQRKDGALFAHEAHRSCFHFAEGFTPGWGHTYQVQRERFDTILADHAIAAGATIAFGQEVTAYIAGKDGPRIQLQASDTPDETSAIQPRFVLDASGFGRVLPKLLGLLRPSPYPPRISWFGHIEDPKRDETSGLISICTHPQRRDVWYWLIPFSDGSASIGVVAPLELAAANAGDPTAQLRHWLNQEPYMAARTEACSWTREVRETRAYATEVTAHVGSHFALLGNAGGFLDPIFSSGVTIALKSAHMAAGLLDRQLKGQHIDWQDEYITPMQQGIETFRTCVEAWYDGSLQDIIFSTRKSPRIKQMICSILAGYAWDTSNPYVAQHRRRFKTLGTLCSQDRRPALQP